MTTNIYPISGEVRNPGANWHKSSAHENGERATASPKLGAYPEGEVHHG
jgi:hypothetical protein